MTKKSKNSRGDVAIGGLFPEDSALTANITTQAVEPYINSDSYWTNYYQEAAVNVEVTLKMSNLDGFYDKKEEQNDKK